MNPFVVAYHGGTYGTYMAWLIARLVDPDTISDPFTRLGQSHRFVCPNLDAEELDSYRGSSPVIRTHPKTRREHDLSQRMDWISSTFPTVYVYPDPRHRLLCINNFYYKIWPDWWTEHAELPVLHESWPETRGLSLDEIPRWIQREYLSFHLVPAWEDAVEWCHLDRWNNTSCLVVQVCDLLEDLPTTLQRFLCWSGIKPVIDPNVLDQSHQENLALQQYLDQDRVCAQAIRAVMDGYHCVWEPMSLASEAYLQYELRQKGFEIRCHELDTLPCDSLHLRKLLYPVT